jgi:hypothetical protein
MTAVFSLLNELYENYWNQDGNWTLTALLIIVSAALFTQTGGLIGATFKFNKI